MIHGNIIQEKRRCKMLEDKMYGPFKVLSTRKNGRYWNIKLPDSWKIHPTFTIALLEWYRRSDTKKQVIQMDADNAGWKMESMVASGPSHDDAKLHLYLVKWEGFSHDEYTWGTNENVTESSLDMLDNYYGKNPTIETDGRYMKRKKKWFYFDYFIILYVTALVRWVVSFVCLHAMTEHRCGHRF